MKLAAVRADHLVPEAGKWLGSGATTGSLVPLETADRLFQSCAGRRSCVDGTSGGVDSVAETHQALHPEPDQCLRVDLRQESSTVVQHAEICAWLLGNRHPDRDAMGLDVPWQHQRRS